MKMILTIFKKDVRRLWPAVAITLVLLAVLTHQDAWRTDWLAGPEEGWLNVLLPLAWACLVALAVHEEPLVGDRQFWITWPYRRPALLASKALFVIVFIHLPMLLADSFTLAFRGFQPLECIPQLLWKQLVVAVVITVPAVALAAVVRNITQFLLAAMLVAGYLIGASTRPLPWIATDEIRAAVIVIVYALAAVVMVGLQYRRRRTVVPRAIGIAAVVVAGLLSAFWPPIWTIRLQAAIQPAHANLALRLAVPPPEPLLGARPTFLRLGAVDIALPISVTGIPPSEARFGTPLVEIDGPDGQRIRSTAPQDSSGSGNIDLEAYTLYDLQRPKGLRLRLRRSLADSIRNATVTIKGTIPVSLHHPGTTAWMPVGASQAVPGLGRCFSMVVEGNIDQQSVLKVVCESLSPISSASVRLWDPETGGQWYAFLGNSSPVVSGPRETWLSPLYRRQTFFQFWGFAPPTAAPPASRWMVPPEVMDHGKLAITPDIVTGSAALDFEFRNIKLSDYMVKFGR